MILILNTFFSLFFETSAEFLFISLALFLKSDFYQPFESMFKMYNLYLCTDLLSTILVVLSCWITILMDLTVMKNKTMKMFIYLLLCNLILLFFSLKKIWFFIFFESSLFPIFFLILNFGYQSERLKACFYFLVYTIFFSIPFLMSLNFIKGETFFFSNPEEKLSNTWTFFLLFVFLVKLPFFFTHFWLPKAHVEAPVVGSMILAGVLLKMGGYGIMRFCFFICFSNYVVKIFLVVSFVGSVIISFACIFCSDMKQLIAYSSVSHMNFLIMSMMEGSKMSYDASFMLMVVHGLSSSSSFYLADLIYKRSFSRSLFLNKGIMNFLPLSSSWIFLNILASSSVPPTLGSFSEVMIISVIFFKCIFSIFLLLFYLFLSSFYFIFFYFSLVHGNFFKKNLFFPFSFKENFILFLHHLIILNLTFLSELFIF